MACAFGIETIEVEIGGVPVEVTDFKVINLLPAFAVPAVPAVLADLLECDDLSGRVFRPQGPNRRARRAARKGK